MSPALKVDDPIVVVRADTFSLNSIVAFHPPKKFRFDNEDVLFISRIVGFPGDSISMVSAKVFLNGEIYPHPVETKLSYSVETSMPLNEKKVEAFEYEINGYNQYTFFATSDEIEELRKNKAVLNVESNVDQSTFGLILNKSRVTGMDTWKEHRIPKKGDSIVIDDDNIELFRPLIVDDEESPPPVLGQRYIVQKNYYFLLGDNRHNSLDSRFIGFVAEDQIAGVVYKR